MTDLCGCAPTVAPATLRLIKRQGLDGMRLRTNAALGVALLLCGGPVVAQSDMRPLPRPGSEVQRDAVGTVELAAAAVSAGNLAADGSDLAVETLTAAPAVRPADLMDGHELRAALDATKQGDWDRAEVLTDDGSVEALVLQWQELRAGRGDFAAYSAFLKNHADWPGLDLLRSRGESEIPEDAAPKAVLDYFGEALPRTGTGALRLARALEATGKPAEAKAEILRAWRELDMSGAEEQAIAAAYDDVVRPHHTDRLQMYLWADDRTGAERMMKRVDDGWKALARARLALQESAPGVDALIAKVPARLQDDGGLAYDRMYWRIEKKRRDDAADMILEQSTSAEALGEPMEWARWRGILARQAMRDGKGKRAYDLAANHHIAFTTEDYDFADLEWLAGYVALTYLKDAELALRHFETFTKAVYTPISLGRGYYWQGRTLEKLGRQEEAMAAYREGGVHQTSFYGQLAAEKAGVEMDPLLTGRHVAQDWREAPFMESDVLKAAVRFFDAGQTWETVRFLGHMAETLPVDQLEALCDFALSLGDPFVAVKVAKKAARQGVVAPRAYYPLTDLGPDRLPVEEALALSIARRESEFNKDAVSPVGARGLMQLMPATANSMSKKLGLRYAASKLTDDPTYNARLGSAYLAVLNGQFDNNYMLVSAGYNAGPGRPRSWMKRYGDPRTGEMDVVDWIEHIPFEETQTYVMRVTESLPIYRARLTGEVQPFRLSEELRK
jgi:soluble lytic murein transglycosylase